MPSLQPNDLPYASIVVASVSPVLPLLKDPVSVGEARSTDFAYALLRHDGVALGAGRYGA